MKKVWQIHLLFYSTLTIVFFFLIFLLKSDENSSLRTLQGFYENPWENPSLQVSWSSFKKKYNKTYSSEEVEKTTFKIWLDNAKSAKASSKGKTWVGGENSLSDMSDEEFKSTLLTLKPPSRPSLKTTAAELAPALDSINWVEKKMVTKIKDQGKCGSCWAFSTIAALESLALISGTPLALSEQHLLSCAADHGCNGSWPATALEWIIKNGVTNRSSWPYAANDTNKSKCPNPNKLDFQFQSIGNVASGNLDELARAVSVQPVIVGVDSSNWKSYVSGIFDSCSDSIAYTDHAVLVVGYTKDYWLIKNSWGDQWGEKGYIKLLRNTNKNTCGIANWAFYPIIKLVDTSPYCGMWKDYCTNNPYVACINFIFFNSNFFSKLQENVQSKMKDFF